MKIVKLFASVVSALLLMSVVSCNKCPKENCPMANADATGSQISNNYSVQIDLYSYVMVKMSIVSPKDHIQLEDFLLNSHNVKRQNMYINYSKYAKTFLSRSLCKNTFHQYLESLF